MLSSVVNLSEDFKDSLNWADLGDLQALVYWADSGYVRYCADKAELKCFIIFGRFQDLCKLEEFGCLGEFLILKDLWDLICVWDWKSFGYLSYLLYLKNLIN